MNIIISKTVSINNSVDDTWSVRKTMVHFSSLVLLFPKRESLNITSPFSVRYSFIYLLVYCDVFY